jgi:putative MATE family efflux protein
MKTEQGGRVVPAAPPAAPRGAWRDVLLLTWPVLLQQFLVFGVNFSDRLLAGWFERDVAYQAAQTTASYLAWTLTSYMYFVTIGSTALVARLVGAGDRRAAVHATNQALLLAAALGLAGGVAGLAFADGIVWSLGLRGETAAYAAAYLRPLFLLLPFQMVEMAGIACLVGAGDTQPSLWVLGGVAVLNVPLAWGFFHGVGPLHGLGFTGISLGTAVSHTLGCGVVLALLARGRSGLWLRPPLLRPDGGLLWRLLRVGVPAGTDSMSASLAQLAFLAIVNQLGDEASTAHGIALGWEAMAYLPGAAFGTAAMALMGQNLGAGRPDRAARSGWSALALGGGFMCAMGAVFFVLAPYMFLLFCPQPEKHPVIELGVPVLRLVAFAMPAFSCYMIFSYALRGAGDTRVPLLFTWTGFLLVRLPLAYVLTRPAVGWGLFGAWLAMFADLHVRGVCFLARFAGGRWQRVRV